jgi:hypothetical protein
MISSKFSRENPLIFSQAEPCRLLGSFLLSAEPRS